MILVVLVLCVKYWCFIWKFSNFVIGISMIVGIMFCIMGVVVFWSIGYNFGFFVVGFG